jgi:hypothetical protein
MSTLPVFNTVLVAMRFPIKSAHALSRRLGFASALSLIGTCIIVFTQAEGGDAASETIDVTSWPYWIGAVLLIVGSLMITNGAIQVRLKTSLASKVWSLGNRELGQFAVGIFGIIVVLVIGVLLVILYWFSAMVLNASVGIEAGDSISQHFVLAALASGAIGLFVAIRLAPLPAYISDQNQFAVEASWRVTRGLFWRVFGILLLLTVLYSVLWLLGVAIAAIAASVFAFEGKPSSVVTAWHESYLDLFTWPFTIYGQIAVCAAIGSIYDQLVLNGDKPSNEQSQKSE